MNRVSDQIFAAFTKPFIIMDKWTILDNQELEGRKNNNKPASRSSV